MFLLFRWVKTKIYLKRRAINQKGLPLVISKRRTLSAVRIISVQGSIKADSLCRKLNCASQAADDFGAGRYWLTIEQNLHTAADFLWKNQLQLVLFRGRGGKIKLPFGSAPS